MHFYGRSKWKTFMKKVMWFGWGKKRKRCWHKESIKSHLKCNIIFFTLRLIICRLFLLKDNFFSGLHIIFLIFLVRFDIHNGFHESRHACLYLVCIEFIWMCLFFNHTFVYVCVWVSYFIMTIYVLFLTFDNEW